MAKVAAVKEAVKEGLIGSHETIQPSAQIKARFVHHAIKDEETGELYMGADEFIDAVAPPDEDYVSCPSCPSRQTSLATTYLPMTSPPP